MKFLRSLPLLVIFSAFLVVGFILGVSSGLAEDPAPVATAQLLHETRPQITSTATQKPIPANGQRSILVIGVDQLGAGRPRLESLWLILYFPDQTQYTFLPLYPAALKGGSDQDLVIEETFQLTADHTPNPAFFAALQSLDLWWTHYAVIDEVALSEMIDVIGGVQDSDQRLTGVEAVSGIPSSWEDPKAALAGQAAMLQKLCATPIGTSLINDPGAVLGLLDSHIHTNLKPDELMAEMRKLSLSEQQATCEFPTLPK